MPRPSKFLGRNANFSTLRGNLLQRASNQYITNLLHYERYREAKPKNREIPNTKYYRNPTSSPYSQDAVHLLLLGPGFLINFLEPVHERYRRIRYIPCDLTKLNSLKIIFNKYLYFKKYFKRYLNFVIQVFDNLFERYCYHLQLIF